jgi:hypothetical protein
MKPSKRQRIDVSRTTELPGWYKISNGEDRPSITDAEVMRGGHCQRGTKAWAGDRVPVGFAGVAAITVLSCFSDEMTEMPEDAIILRESFLCA